MKKVNVLFVCMGNICRSPTAQGVFEKLVSDAGLSEDIGIDSAGTHAYHIGNPPDQRALTAASLRGYDLSSQKARRIAESDFESFEYIFAMDRDNMRYLLSQCPIQKGYASRIRLFLEFTGLRNIKDVPDPYYGGGSGFERVLDIVEEGSKNLLQVLRTRHGL